AKVKDAVEKGLTDTRGAPRYRITGRRQKTGNYFDVDSPPSAMRSTPPLPGGINLVMRQHSSFDIPEMHRTVPIQIDQSVSSPDDPPIPVLASQPEEFTL